MNSKDNFADYQAAATIVLSALPFSLDFCYSHFGSTLCLVRFLSTPPGRPFSPAAVKIPLETDAVMQIPARIFINVILRRSEGGSPHGTVKGWRVINGSSDVTKPKERVGRICAKPIPGYAV